MDTFDWTNLSQLICPSTKKDNLNIYNNITILVFFYND